MALPAKQTYNIPTAGLRSVNEPKVTAAVASVNAAQNNWYEYLDRDGTTYPGALNKGLETNFLAAQSVKSLQLYPQAANAIFRSSDTSLATLNPTFVSDQITLTTTFDNAKVLWTYHFNVIFATGTSPLISEHEQYLERSGSSGFTAGTGSKVLPTSGATPVIRMGDSADTQYTTSSYTVIDTLATAGTYYYRFTADENQVASKATIRGTRSWYTYMVFNGIS